MLLGAAAHVQSPPPVQDGGAWVLLLTQLPVSDAWVVHEEVQPRWNDAVTQRRGLAMGTSRLRG